MVTVSVIQVRRTPRDRRSCECGLLLGVGQGEDARGEVSPAIRVRASRSSMWRKERLKPRTPVSEPTPMATARTTKRNLAREARISRQAMRMAVLQESSGRGVTGRLSLTDDKAVVQDDAAVGALGQRSARA